MSLTAASIAARGGGCEGGYLIAMEVARFFSFVGSLGLEGSGLVAVVVGC